MKTKFLIFLALLLSCFVLKAQEKKEKVPAFQMTPMPTISYNSDIGLQLGGLCDMYYYGDGSTFPNYLHKLYLDIGWATKGSKYIHLYYDSSHLIKNIRFTFAATYRMSSFYPFMGFNGLASPYDSNKDLNKADKIAFYSVSKNMLRIISTFQGKIYGHLNWVAGGTLWKIEMNDIKSKDYDISKSLFREYIKSGVIDPKEIHGGTHIEGKLGLTYDSRDFEANPSKGMWIEAYLFGSKDFFQKRNDYLKLALHFRQYINIIPNRLNFAYHIGYQGLLAGKCPYYLQTEIATILLKQVGTDGLGGYNTVRGMLMNRLVGNSYAWSNIELRMRLFSFKFLHRDWSLFTNPLFDMGYIVQPYRLKEMKASKNPLIYDGKTDKLHCSAGLGMKLAINYNFILSVEYAKPFMKQDGNYGVNVGLNYIF